MVFSPKQCANFRQRLRFLPVAKAIFKVICVELGVATLHNVWRNMLICWNSTELMMEDIEHTWDAM
jgi:hypothetical protein